MMGGLGLWWLVPLFWIAFIALFTLALISFFRVQNSSQSVTMSVSKAGINKETLKNEDTSGESSRKEVKKRNKTCENKKYPDFWIRT